MNKKVIPLNLDSVTHRSSLRPPRSSADCQRYSLEQYLNALQRKKNTRRIIGYCCVGESYQTSDLSTQKVAINQFCLASNRQVNEFFTDIGHGTDYTRKNFVQLMGLIESGQVSEIIATHTSKLFEGGIEWLEKLCLTHNCTLTMLTAPNV